MVSQNEADRVKFSIQVDKKIGMSKDMAIDTEPHLLFDNIQDLYNEKGDLDDKYKYLLQLSKNRGAEGSSSSY
jgi:hypothetical protein